MRLWGKRRYKSISGRGTKEVKQDYNAVLCAHLRFFCLAFKMEKVEGLLEVEETKELIEWVRDLVWGKGEQ